MNASAEKYHAIIRELSGRIVEAQRPIRILDAIKWDAGVQEAFFASRCQEQPPVDRSYYERRPLGFDLAAKRQQFHEIDRDVIRLLGQFNPLGQILRRICREYQMVVRMLDARGLPEFASISEELYGSASDAFHAGDPTLADLGAMMADTLANLDRSESLPAQERTLTGEQAVEILQQRLNQVFAGFPNGVRVLVSDGIVADAAAGADYLKIRKEARFNHRDLRVLEVHEGWVHLGTTLNGLNQPVCTFLSKGPPSSTITQEGLAIIMEIITFASYPARLRRLTNRVRAVDMAEQGATFLDVFRFFADQGLGERESYTNAMRVFRGSTPTAGPFTKDLSYSKGFILIYNYIRLAVRKGMLERIPLLFCGKTPLEDMRSLAQLVEEGIVAPPVFLPPPFADLNGLAAWMCYSNFLNRLSLHQVEADYANIL
ncbi:MAG: flavohemoglobin expression-modulating QEGLA motif protein [Pseudomonadota bacterium]|nr:flavohemoglobin expression-modulating QEGLA motif protein [Pseudomonadota bacterium]